MERANRFKILIFVFSTVFFGSFGRTVEFAAANSMAKGFLDSVDCNVAVGWACDPDGYSTPLQVHFYADGLAGSGTYLGSTTASSIRESAVGNECGGRVNHGFSWVVPDSLKNGSAHAIYAYAIDIPGGGNPLLSGSPKTINCCLPKTCTTLGNYVCGFWSDGCSGTLNCGTCASGQICNSSGKCISTCIPKTCTTLGNYVCGSWSDGCSGTLNCGTCASGQICNSSGQCVATCTPNCTGKSCGSDGCSGSCGTCGAGQTCNSGQCVATCTPNCTGKSCGSDGCSGSCGTCGAGQTCNSGQCVAGCTPNCTGKSCGSDGCSGSCGTCGAGQTCNSGQCVAGCASKTCMTLGNYVCGSWSDGCSGTLNCGSCGSSQTCNSSGQCVASGCLSHDSKKCEGEDLYWYNSCNVKEEMAQDCGVDVLTTNYQCSGNWLQQGVIAKDCVSNACTQSAVWNNVQDCSATGKVCKNGVCVAADTVPPVITGLAPKGTIYNSAIILTATTNEAADCRYSWYNVSYDQMTLQFNSSNKLYHSASAVLAKYGDYKYYVRCRDNAGNINSSSSLISFSYISSNNTTVAPVNNTTVKKPAVADTVPPVITGLAPSGEIATSTVVITADTNEKASCKYDIADTDYDSMENNTDASNTGTHHTKSITIANQTSFNYYIRCKDVAGNKNTQSAKISFTYAPVYVDGPAVFNLSPSGTIYQGVVALGVSTDRPAECRYASQDIDFDSMDGQFAATDGEQQQAMVTLNDYRAYDYYIRCKDQNGNKDTASQVISFEYKNPDLQSVEVASDSTATEPVACADYQTGTSDDACNNARDCVCDPDCPAAADAAADPDCADAATAKKEPSGSGLVIAAVAGFLLIAIIVVALLIISRRKSGEEIENEL